MQRERKKRRTCEASRPVTCSLASMKNQFFLAPPFYSHAKSVGGSEEARESVAENRLDEEIVRRKR